MKPERNEEREERIENEILVDTYNEYEAKGAWQEYLSDNISFPFTAKIKVKDKQGNESLISVEAVGFEGKNRFRVNVSESGTSRLFSESLLKIKEIKADFDTKQAINDWKYWRAQGNLF
jgi:hypothetical protein